MLILVDMDMRTSMSILLNPLVVEVLDSVSEPQYPFLSFVPVNIQISPGER